MKTGIREKRNKDVSHKQAPGRMSDERYLHIKYPILVKAVALALHVMKRLDRQVLGPASIYLWQKMRTKRYSFMSPPKAGYLLLPYLNLSPEERLVVVKQETDEGQNGWSVMPTLIDGEPANILVCKKWGIIVLGDRAMPLATYPLVELKHISTKATDNTSIPMER